MSLQPELSPFGTHALPPLAERLRRWSGSLSVNPLNRRVTAVLRRVCMAGRDDPFDIVLEEGPRIRVYPRSNRCEKLAFAGYQFWDAPERLAIAREIREHRDVRPFVFCDIGANVGLYSLDAAFRAKERGLEIRIVAVEPDPVTRARLQTNVEANELANIDIVPWAIAAKAGTAHLTEAGRNRGRVRLSESETRKPVRVEPLAALLREMNINQIDAMKIDIEGRDAEALSAFFAEAPQAAWPQLLIVEAGRATEPVVVRLAQERGYAVRERTRLNAILALPARVREV